MNRPKGSKRQSKKPKSRKWPPHVRANRRAQKLVRWNEMTLSKEMQAVYPFGTVLEMLVRGGGLVALMPPNGAERERTSSRERAKAARPNEVA